MPIFAGKVAPDSVVYTDCYRSYKALDVSDFYHERINHSRAFVTGKNHINGVESFWNQTKRVLRKYNGIHPRTFPLFPKDASLDLIMAVTNNSLKCLKFGWHLT